jgi:hypothetical protein
MELQLNKVATDKTLTTQEKNWEIFSVLGLKWDETTTLTETDREFLLTKVEGIKEQIKLQRASQGMIQ